MEHKKYRVIHAKRKTASRIEKAPEVWHIGEDKGTDYMLSTIDSVLEHVPDKIDDGDEFSVVSIDRGDITRDIPESARLFVNAYLSRRFKNY